jgi:ABC-type uncharacterized transport system permease subunit
MINQSPSWARRTLGAYAFALACVVSVGLGVFLVTRDKTLKSDQVLSSIGLELIASVIFATIFTLRCWTDALTAWMDTAARAVC